eukprot:gb/GECG01008860.1/.p1 GENE.gb/GECG01008860.1/~~gb/GECG01008860.1/.p1  ORF type:complete len:140 (+),score=7.37 gb/GECG01008860.1/:1-420(+)
MSYFNFFAWIIFVPAIILVGILVLPMPAVVRRVTLKFCDYTLFFTVSIGSFSFPLISLVFGIASVTFLESVYTAHTRMREYSELKHTATVRADEMLPKKWRAERNAWIAGFAFTCWIVVYRYRQLLYEKIELEEKLKRK